MTRLTSQYFNNQPDVEGGHHHVHAYSDDDNHNNGGPDLPPPTEVPGGTPECGTCHQPHDQRDEMITIGIEHPSGIVPRTKSQIPMPECEGRKVHGRRHRPKADWSEEEAQQEASDRKPNDAPDESQCEHPTRRRDMTIPKVVSHV